MIPGINMTGSSMHYQRQLTVVKDIIPPPVSQDNSSAKGNGADYKVNLNTQTNRIEQEYSAKKEKIQQEHATDIKQLEMQYSMEQKQIEQEYTMKKRSLGINIYA
ncbi:MAG: hypothetical protein HQK67_11420 [Desulfamplus sp.]|nr:hypothetical protein [Desulfamplus sp.]